MPIFESKDKKSAILTILLIVIVGIGAYLVSEINEMNAYEQEAKVVYESYNKMKADYVFGVISEYYKCSEILAEEIKSNIIIDVKNQYGTNIDKLKYDLSNTDKNNLLNTILNNNIKGIYFRNIQNDANDPFIATRQSIITDLSSDCAVDTGAENKSNRSFDEEYKLHFNKYLVKEFFTNMVAMNDSESFWIFPKPKINAPWYADLKNIKHMDIDNLKEIFIKYDSNLEVLQQIEFIQTAVIYSDSDLAGRPTVLYNGYKNIESNQIFVNTPFNAYDAITLDTGHMQTLEQFESQKAQLTKVVETNIRNKTIIVTIMSALLVIMFVAVVKITDDIE